MSKKMIITIDGPSASGKGTLAKALAEALGFYYLDTGAIYRLLALKILQDGQDPADEAYASAAALAFKDAFDPEMIANPAIRTDEVAQGASKAAAHKGVRAALLDVQRTLAHQPPAPYKGSLLEGRDTGTVVCPDADIKLFLTASAPARAQRRTKDLQSRGIEATYEAVLKDLEERDERDIKRAVAPLKAADDAVIVDTSQMDAKAALAHVLDIVAKHPKF